MSQKTHSIEVEIELIQSMLPKGIRFAKYDSGERIFIPLGKDGHFKSVLSFQLIACQYNMPDSLITSKDIVASEYCEFDYNTDIQTFRLYVNEALKRIQHKLEENNLLA